MTKDTNNQLIQKARELAAQALTDRVAQTRQTHPTFSSADMYVVWFAKELQNWKALVSTNCISSDDALGDYVEVTYNGDKHEAYCDVYRKTLNVCYKD